MFEVAEVGRKIPKKHFAPLERELRVRLLEAQFAARDAGVPVIVVISGVDGAGKGEVVDRLTEWLDTRELEVRAFWDETDEERDRPHFWRYWRAMPARGRTAVFFGSWYTAPIIDHALGRIDDAELDRRTHRMERVERMLAEDGAVLVKLWFHLTLPLQRKRLRQDLKARGLPRKAIPREVRARSRDYDAFVRTSERALRNTDSVHSPWHLIEASDHRYRDLQAGRVLAETVERAVAAAGGPGIAPSATGSAQVGVREATLPPVREARIGVLDEVDLSVSVDSATYEQRLVSLQTRLYRLAWAMRQQRARVVVVFEGWDAAGKGGVIRRLTQAMDARLYRTISVGAPTDEERGHHYLWRFWRHVPMSGNMTLYDRSWYGRVLVERVEGLAAPREWQRAYREINEFEEQLVEHGTVLLKFWLHISPEEQLARFRDRERTPWKRHKIGPEDWRNREQRPRYEQAVDEMVARTSTEYAPWRIVGAESKRYARLDVIETLCERLEAAGLAQT